MKGESLSDKIRSECHGDGRCCCCDFDGNADCDDLVFPPFPPEGSLSDKAQRLLDGHMATWYYKNKDVKEAVRKLRLFMESDAVWNLPKNEIHDVLLVIFGEKLI